MKRRHHVLAAAGLLTAHACSSAPAAYRERATTSAVPPAEPSTSEGAGSPPPASSTSTTVTIAGMPATTIGTTTTTTLTVTPAALLPENVGVELSDAAWAARERILACIRSYEGVYSTETGNGFHGGYQFVQSTWDGVVGRAGYPQWIGRRAGDAPAHVQDDAAWLLYTEQGFGPWPPASRYCR